MQCPAEVWDSWYAYHMPCVKSFHEKVGLIDAYQSALGLLKLAQYSGMGASSSPLSHAKSTSNETISSQATDHTGLRLRHRQQ